MSHPHILHLFTGYGVELEYMIVDEETLFVKPIADTLLRSPDGDCVNEVERDQLCWSNELVAHVVELKTNGPSADLHTLPPIFLQSLRDIHARLQPYHATLMPTAMHPWMNPHTETRLWPHDNNIIYESYNRIFDCRGHGWSNLQSIHLNLPYANDDEFARLHTAVRLLLPLLPALAASSPIYERHRNGTLNNRMAFYRTNSKRIPSVTGHVIPEPVYSEAEYADRILQPMYADIAPLDPDGILQDDWLNARGAIARFERKTIEIRVLDIQENPIADLAILSLIDFTLKNLVQETWCCFADQKTWSTVDLEQILLDCIQSGEKTVVQNRLYSAVFGLPTNRTYSAGELWRHLIESYATSSAMPELFAPWYRIYQQEGTLASRILEAIPLPSEEKTLHSVYQQLCQCLLAGTHFHAQ